MSELFNFKKKGALREEEKVVGGRYFNPQPETSAKPYVVAIKCLPNILEVQKLDDVTGEPVFDAEGNPVMVLDTQDSFPSSRRYVLKDDEGTFNVSSPLEEGKRKCTIATQYWKLMEQETAQTTELAKQLSLRKYYGCIIQVTNDLQNPENNGKIFKYKIPVKVYDMIHAAMKPSDADIATGSVIQDLLNPFASHDIVLTVVKTDDGRNYDKSKIAQQTTAMKIDGVAITETPEMHAKVVELLKREAEELDIMNAFGYVASTDEEKARVKTLLVNKFGAAPTILPTIKMNEVAATNINNIVGADGGQPLQPSQPDVPSSPVVEDVQETQATETQSSSDMIQNIVGQ